MEESTLLTAALASSIIGIVILFIISGSIDVSESDISRITNGEIEGQVSISGVVAGITEKDDFTIIEIERTDTIPLFASDSVHVDVGDHVRARGTVEKYEGRKEIMADEVTVI